MINLSNDFNRRTALGDTRNILIAKLYYGVGTNDYLLISTANCILGERQVLPILTSIDGCTSTWNLLDANNNVTLAMPTLKIAEYTTPDGYSVMDEFNRTNFIGNIVEVRMGFADQEWEHMIPFITGTIEEISYDDHEISLEILAKQFSDINIGARKITSVSGLDNTDYAGLTAPSKVLNKYIPVHFGQHWCAPIQLIHQDTAGKIYYCTQDTGWANFISSGVNTTTQYLNNINKTQLRILLSDNEYYTPYHQYNTSGQQNYNSGLLPVATLGLPALVFSTSGHFSNLSDESFFCEVPMRYELSSNTYSYPAYGYAISGTLSNIFNGGAEVAPDYQITFSGSNATHDARNASFKFNTQISRDLNLRHTASGSIFPGRRVHVPYNEFRDDDYSYYDAFLLGHYSIYCDRMADNANFNANTNLTVYNWFETAPGITSNITPYSNTFIGGARINLDINSNTSRVNGYKYITKTYYSGLDQDLIATDYTQNNLAGFPAYPPVVNGAGIPIVPTVYENALNSLPRLLRESWDKGTNKTIYSRFELNATTYYRNFIWKLFDLFLATRGKVSAPWDEFIYTPLSGFKIASTTGWVSVSGLGTNYQLKRPYEYLEAILRKDGATASDLGLTWSNVSGLWIDCHASLRDGSGFNLIDETKLSDFIKDYVKNELFTVYSDEQNKYQITQLKSVYSQSDIVGLLDWNDSTSFAMDMTDTKNIKTEIKDLSTDYTEGLGSDNKYNIVMSWKIPATEYNYSFYDSRNTYTKNKFYVDKLEKKYTSYVNPDRVTFGGVTYSCLRSCIDKAPIIPNRDYWRVAVAINTSAPAYDSNTQYNGIDSENYIIAKRLLNQYANRHRVVTFKTNKLVYAKYQIGDIIGFANVPQTLLGMNILGFAGSTAFTRTLNNQTVYGAFVVTGVKKSLDSIDITATQLHCLNSYTPVCVAQTRGFI
jgi:hypothetical protein